jgi:pyruvate-ferredoxin/flavodoxin oxidoreductase
MMLCELIEQDVPVELKKAAEELVDNFDDIAGSRKSADVLCQILSESDLPLAQKILKSKDMLAKKTFWMFGGDGWAYDIGFGGLDHVVASGENINVLVVDTEVYSNTGGQSSKATPIGAVAQFASSGKASPKKDLGAIFMTYGNVYVAQVAMGADPNQLIKAIREAEEFDGPSVIIAYTPCLSHGLKCGMGCAQDEMKRAVEAGYWTLYRYNPSDEKPFTLDSKAPSASYAEFLAGETRYAALKRTFPDNAMEFFAKGAAAAEKKYQNYKRMEDIQ